MDGNTYLAAASIVVALVGAGAAELSRRAAAKASRENALSTSRTDIEKEAFERAKDYYGDAMNRQDREIGRQDTELIALHVEVDELKKKVRDLEHDLAVSENQVRTLAAQIAARGSDL